ncbi:helix-turn-helix transcriptional regulator [Paenibacillus koleovorans]|uniref:helix-turn-helix transcriptional regulator n=1 Tax=Paenibacillus koleovorans TaxID=121608 RepID=UPI0035A2433B
MRKLLTAESTPTSEVLTVPEMAKRLSIGKRSAYEMIETPGFPHYKLGERQTRVIWSEVIDWMRRGEKPNDESIEGRADKAGRSDQAAREEDRRTRR